MLYNVLKCSLISSFLGLSISLSSLFPNTCNLCYSPTVRYYVSQPYNTTGKIILLQILTINDLKRRQEDKFLIWLILSELIPILVSSKFQNIIKWLITYDFITGILLIIFTYLWCKNAPWILPILHLQVRR